jgi:hypothetical protein
MIYLSLTRPDAGFSLSFPQWSLQMNETRGIGSLKEYRKMDESHSDKPSTDCIASRLKAIDKILEETRTVLGNSLAVIRGHTPEDPGKKLEARQGSILNTLSEMKEHAEHNASMATELREYIGE